MVALGKISFTSYSAWNLVDKSIEGESGLAPAALNYINLTTSGFFAQAFAILLESSMLIYSASPNFLIPFLGPIKFITTFELEIALSIIASSSKSNYFIKYDYPETAHNFNSFTQSS